MFCFESRQELERARIGTISPLRTSGQKSTVHVQWSLRYNYHIMDEMTPGPVPFGTSICSDVETILS